MKNKSNDMISITHSSTTTEVVNYFTEVYPLLTLRFYSKPHAEFEGSKASEEITESIDLCELSDTFKPGNIDIRSDVTAKALEEAFEQKFGLHVQLFRKSGDIWLQTSKTDSWTLAKHQEKATEAAT